MDNKLLIIKRRKPREMCLLLSNLKNKAAGKITLRDN